ncbi:GMC family oxidoreductase N-terminal domain-containing protein [Dactylosporangium maewongense]|uniref:GMC family oxidoreductase N-terminal domain-containing protein n=1 Tax=Dactylosporangium maewongense TaxID=634393 RepID=A0ABP4KEG3_9ACTN
MPEALPEDLSDLTFDTVVAGGGTAGCVLANRLSATGERVALVEAGPDFGHSRGGAWPPVLNDARYVPTPYDWGYHVAPYGYDIPFIRGRVLGGSSVINAAGINWGLREDYARWVELGAEGWGFEDLRPFLLKVERLRGDDAPGRGRDGALFVSRDRATSPLLDDLRRAYAAAGLPGPIDASGPDAAEGWGDGTRNADGDERYHAARAYLDDVRDRPNLTVIGDTLIDRVLWDGDTVTGVAVVRDGRPSQLRARRVVLAAGAIGTPTVLQRSGIGDAAALAPILGDGVPLHHLPGVGRNLHDHYGSRLFMRTAPGFAERLAARGHVPGTRQSLFARVKSDPALPAYDLSIGVNHGDTAPPDGLLPITVFLVHLAAEGSVTIADADPHSHPVIDLDIGRDEDLDAIARGLRWLRRRLADPAVRDWFAPEAAPEASESAVGDADLREYVRRNIFLFHHATGTGRLGPARDPLAVAGLDGRVHGFTNLYIGDASLMPSIPRGMMILTVYAMAEKIAAGLVATAPVPR